MLVTASARSRTCFDRLSHHEGRGGVLAVPWVTAAAVGPVWEGWGRGDTALYIHKYIY